MKDIEKYYKNTKDATPHENIKKFLKINSKVGKAIDLGCGTGRDTIYLIKNNWNVTAIDRENVEELIKEKLNDKEKKQFKFISGNFENIEIEKNNLVIANFSIPFCNKDYFNIFWKKIVESISEGRIFYWKFLWIK